MSTTSKILRLYPKHIIEDKYVALLNLLISNKLMTEEDLIFDPDEGIVRSQINMVIYLNIEQDENKFYIEVTSILAYPYRVDIQDFVDTSVIIDDLDLYTLL